MVKIVFDNGKVLKGNGIIYTMLDDENSEMLHGIYGQYSVQNLLDSSMAFNRTLADAMEVTIRGYIERGVK